MPFTAGSIGGVNVGGNGRSAWAGFLYCSISEKIGTVFSEATKLPLMEILANPTWMLNLVQARKLDMDVAKPCSRSARTHAGTSGRCRCTRVTWKNRQ